MYRDYESYFPPSFQEGVSVLETYAHDIYIYGQIKLIGIETFQRFENLQQARGERNKGSSISIAYVVETLFGEERRRDKRGGGFETSEINLPSLASNLLLAITVVIVSCNMHGNSGII